MKLLLAILIVVSGASGQLRPETGAATSTGTCSPANTGNNNQFTITCGIGQQQGNRMIEILNKILSNQLDPDAVMARLDEIKNGVDELRRANTPRRLSTPQQNLLFSRLNQVPVPRVKLIIKNGNPETSDLSYDFLNVFKRLGWTADGPHTDLIPSGARGIGIVVKSQAQHPQAADVLVQSLREFGLALEAALDDNIAADEIHFFIAAKP